MPVEPAENRNEAERANKSLLSRVFSVDHVIPVVAGLAVFAVLVWLWSSNVGIVVAAIVSGVVTGVTWAFTAKSQRGPDLRSVLEGFPMLGAIPADESGPAPALTESDTAHRYTGLLGEIEARTTGRVVLVSSPAPGQGSSTVSLNVAIAAAKAGRRVMLIDADPSPHGIGRFLSSGNSPGLSDVAAGTATLAEATRMWTVDDGTRFPMLPSGSDLSDVGALAGLLVADALDTVSERADLIVIDVPPILWSDATPELGRHADGTILVLSDTADATVVSNAISQLDSVGAPVLGYVRNRSKGTKKLAPPWFRKAGVRAVGMAAGLLVLFALFTGLTLWNSWRSVETQSFSRAEVQALASDPTASVEEASEDEEISEDDARDAENNTPGTTAPGQAYETVLLIGSDEVAGAADVILYLVLPTNGADPFMVSLPRDLYVENPCTGRQGRINTLMRGCESEGINGPTLLAFQVGQFTGIEVDNFALFDFQGFEKIIDGVGGVEICVDYPVRDEKAQLSLPAGCTNATGAQALAWVRSRHTEQKINGSWRTVPGAGDLLRNQHQQDVIIELFKKLKTFDSPAQLTDSVASLADTFVLSDTLGLSDAVNLAWSIRGIDIETINRIEIPVRLTRSKTGQSILVAKAPFDEVLKELYGGSLPSEDLGPEEASAQSR
jgi:LCP family protein required for cell wall assembly